MVFDTNCIPENFLQDQSVKNDLHSTVFKLEQSMHTQADIDEAYLDLCTVIKSEMISKIPSRTILCNGVDNKKTKER